jgi:4-amino-4-deoxy-L-arabinose transferase-like glycosyltransferase
MNGNSNIFEVFRKIKPLLLKKLSYQKHSIFLIFAILLLGTALRLYRLGHQSLWNDEVWSVLISNSSVIEILTVSFWRDTHQPLYYLILNFFMSFGKSEAILRLPSLIFGVMSIGFFYLILRNWLGEKYGYLGAFLLAISPFHIWYSQETRPYATLLFFGLLSIFFLQKLIKYRTNRFRAGFIISAATTYFTHSIALPFFLFIALYVFFCRSKQEWKYWIVTFGGIVLLISPTFLPLLMNPPSYSADPFRDVNLAQIGYIFWAFSTGYSFGPSLVDLHFMSSNEVMQQYFIFIIAVASLVGSLVMYGLYKLWTKEKETFLLVILWLLVPIISIIVAATFSRHPINVRYVILAFPAFLISLTVGIAELRFKRMFLPAFLIFIFISSYSLYNYFEKPKYQRENTRAAAEFLAKYADKDDLIIVSAAYATKNLRYYYPNGTVMVGYPKEGRFVNEQTLEQELKEIISERDKFWLFLSRTYHSDPKGLIRKYCDMNYQRIKHAVWNGAELVLYR